MTKPWSIIPILLTFICSCSDSTPHADDTLHSNTHCGITIRNSAPRGGGYTDPAGKNFGFRVFRERIINDTIIPIEVSINFSGAFAAMLPKSERHVRTFLFPDTLTPDQHEDVYNYGIIGLQSFLDTGLNKSTTLKITIAPKEEYTLYIGTLFYPTEGMTRAGLFINEKKHDIPMVPVKFLKTDTKNENELNLVFGIGINHPNNYLLIPCGQIVFKP